MTGNTALWLSSRRAPLRVDAAPFPVPQTVEIVVRARAVAVNPIDRLTQTIGDLVTSYLRYPAVLGSDVAGDVVAVGADITRFAIGDCVVGYAAGSDKTRNRASEGAFQTHVVLLAHMTAPLPDDLSFEAAAVLPGVSNNTSVDLGPLTVRNIFGYRTVKSAASIDAAGLNPIFLPGFLGPFFGKAPAAAPFELLPLDASQVIDRRYISEELQFFGSNESKTFDWIAGGFFYDRNSAGPMGSAFRAFVTPDTPRSFTTAHVHVKSYALFAQVGYQLVPGLKLNLGGRYTWDRVRACSGAVVADRYGTRSECEAKAALDVVDGTGIVRARSDKPSWTVGPDYTVNRDVFLYAVSRRGIRGANVNTPLFELPFTTGNPTACGVPAGTGPCPDLRAVQSTGPEKITDGEIGGKFTFRAEETTARLNVAAFYQKYKNALQFANVAGAGIPAFAPDQPTRNSVAVNSADETIYGVESEFVFNPTRRLTLTLTGAWTHSEIDRSLRRLCLISTWQERYRSADAQLLRLGSGELHGATVVRRTLAER